MDQVLLLKQAPTVIEYHNFKLIQRLEGAIGNWLIGERPHAGSINYTPLYPGR